MSVSCPQLSSTKCGTPLQPRPQNRLIRVASTVALCSPISLSLKGWRTQLAREIRSPSTKVTSSPCGCPRATMAWCKYGNPAAMALPVPPQPTTVTRTFFCSSAPGIRCSVFVAIVVSIAVVIVPHELRERLRQLHQVLLWKRFLSHERLPHRQEAAAKPNVFANAGGVGEFALEERLLPQANGRDRLLLRNLHAPSATHAVVVAVPVGRHAQLRFRLGPLVFGKGANPQMRSTYFEQQGRVGIELAIHVFHGS